MRPESQAALHAEYLRTDSGDCNVGYRNYDDGTRRTLLPWPRRQATGGRMGLYDERCEKPADNAALGDLVPGICNLPVCCGLQSPWRQHTRLAGSEEWQVMRWQK